MRAVRTCSWSLVRTVAPVADALVAGVAAALLANGGGAGATPAAALSAGLTAGGGGKQGGGMVGFAAAGAADVAGGLFCVSVAASGAVTGRKRPTAKTTPAVKIAEKRVDRS